MTPFLAVMLRPPATRTLAGAPALEGVTDVTGAFNTMDSGGRPDASCRTKTNKFYGGPILAAEHTLKGACSD